jgi:hypothetical protein
MRPIFYACKAASIRLSSSLTTTRPESNASCNLHHRPTRIVPVIMEESDLWQFHIRLPRIQYIDFQYESESAKVTLLKTLKSGGNAA